MHETRPKAHRCDADVSVGNTLVRIGHRTVSPLAAFVWLHADGERTIDDLAIIATQRLDVPVGPDAVWLAVDALADAGLLEQRVAPPLAAARAWTRRDVLEAAAAALAVLATTLPRPAAAEPATTPPEALAAEAKRALRESEAARARGELDVAAERLEDAKEASRKRTTAERDAEQEAKDARAESFERAPAGPAPTPADATGRVAPGRERPGADVAPDLAEIDGTRAEQPTHAPGERERYFQEQELKRTQERELKRQR